MGYCEHPYQRDMLAYYKMGRGPFYLFYRPYHLCHVEALECVADAVLDGRSLLEPAAGFRTNVFAYAKRDLRAGEVTRRHRRVRLLRADRELRRAPGTPACRSVWPRISS